MFSGVHGILGLEKHSWNIERGSHLILLLSTYIWSVLGFARLTVSFHFYTSRKIPVQKLWHSIFVLYKITTIFKPCTWNKNMRKNLHFTHFSCPFWQGKYFFREKYRFYISMILSSVCFNGIPCSKLIILF